MNLKAQVFFLTVLLSLTLSASIAQAGSAFDEAVTLEKSGDKAGATIKYREAIKEEPMSFAAEIKLARLLKEVKDYPEAISHFRRAVELSTGRANYGVRKELAALISWTKDKSEAIVIYKELLKEKPTDSEARVGLARVYSWTGHYKEASLEYEKVLESKPENSEARVGLARVNSWQGNYDEAIHMYRGLLKDDPDNTQARVGLVNVLRWKGEISESLREARRFKADKPESKDAKRLVGELRRSKGPYIQLTRSDGEDSDDNRLVRYKLSGYFSVWDDQVVHLSYSTYEATAPNLEADASLFTMKSSIDITKDLTLTPRLSIASLEATREDATRLLSGLSLRWRKSKRLTLNASYSQSMLMDTAQLIKNAIKLDEVSLSGVYNWSIYTVSSGVRFGFYPDGNFSNRFYVNLSRGFIKEDPRLRGGVRFDYVDFDEDLSGGYYDPQEYYALTLHATLEDDYYGERLEYLVVGGLGIQSKGGASGELKASIKGKLTWHFNEHLSAWVQYKWSKSALESSTGYNYNGSEIGIGYLF